WAVLGGGSFKTEEQRKASEGRVAFEPLEEKAIAVSKVLEKLAKEKGTIMTSIALAYVMHKTPNVFPIVGGRKVEHLKGNIAALSIKLSAAEIEEIEDAYPFEYGFPQDFLFLGMKQPTRDGKDVFLTKLNAYIDTVPRAGVIVPREA
ncbi:hypothetical protein LTR95_003387, partial [Oleoguttula sp. CCFEE 5521]